MVRIAKVLSQCKASHDIVSALGKSVVFGFCEVDMQSAVSVYISGSRNDVIRLSDECVELGRIRRNRRSVRVKMCDDNQHIIMSDDDTLSDDDTPFGCWKFNCLSGEKVMEMTENWLMQ